MPKKARRTKKKLGRRVEVSDSDLLDRFKTLKRFLEDNWGRVGLELQKVRRPEDVRKALQLVPRVEQSIPFRDQRAACLLVDEWSEVPTGELRSNQERYKDASAAVDRLWSEYHGARRNAEEATTALQAFISPFQDGIFLLPFFSIAVQFAKTLGIEELTKKSNHLDTSLHTAQEEKKRLEAILLSQEAGFAIREMVRFKQNRRHEKSLMNFAKAMAGLPDYGWLHSLRRCSQIREIKENAFETTLNYQLFQLMEIIIQKTKPLKLSRVESKLRMELLREDGSWLLREYFGRHWWDIEQAFHACVGKRISRKDMPYKLMAAFQDSFERGKTIPEQELAKRAQLV